MRSLQFDDQPQPSIQSLEHEVPGLPRIPPAERVVPPPQLAGSFSSEKQPIEKEADRHRRDNEDYQPVRR
jgi:hypothetical protein